MSKFINLTFSILLLLTSILSSTQAFAGSTAGYFDWQGPCHCDRWNGCGVQGNGIPIKKECIGTGGSGNSPNEVCQSSCQCPTKGSSRWNTLTDGEKTQCDPTGNVTVTRTCQGHVGEMKQNLDLRDANWPRCPNGRGVLASFSELTCSDYLIGSKRLRTALTKPQPGADGGTITASAIRVSVSSAGAWNYYDGGSNNSQDCTCIASILTDCEYLVPQGGSGGSERVCGLGVASFKITSCDEPRATPTPAPASCAALVGNAYDVNFGAAMWANNCKPATASICDFKDGDPTTCSDVLAKSTEIERNRVNLDSADEITIYVKNSVASYKTQGAGECTCSAKHEDCSFYCRGPGGSDKSQLCGVTKGSFRVTSCESPTTSTTPTPTPADPTTCEPTVGGEGRACTDSTECGKCGNTCAIAGNQPYIASKSADISTAIGVNYTETVTSAQQTKNIGPLKVCVAAANVPANLNEMRPPSSVQAAGIDPTLIKIDGDIFRCMLNSGDAHRASAVGCSCQADSEALIVANADYADVNYHLNRNGTRLEAMWAQIVDLTNAHPQIAKISVNHLGDLFHKAVAAGFSCQGGATCTSNSSTTGDVSSCCCPNWSSDGYASRNVCVCEKFPNSTSCVKAATPTPSAPATASLKYSDQSPEVYKSPAQTYGAGANGALAVASGQTLMCAKTCPANSTRVAGKPNECTCNTAGEFFNQPGWSCMACPDGATIPLGAGACVCPSGYEIKTIGGVDKCRPTNPSLEFTDKAPSDGYPVCGAGRAPMTYAMLAKRWSSMGKPNSDSTSTYNTAIYPFAQTVGGLPEYLYKDQPHCGCTMTDIAEDASQDASTAGQLVTIYKPDTYDVIKARTAGNRPNLNSYGMVAIASDSSQDGRLGTQYSSGASKCGCPNINEKPALVGGKVVCTPMVDLTDPNIRFGNFDSVADASNILPGQIDVNDAGGKIVSKIRLPSSATSTAASNTYSRGIWKCNISYVLKPDGKCVFDRALHMCSTGSKVSSTIGGADDSARFANTKNKKLACCMNGFGSLSTSAIGDRFDCVENVDKNYASFNDLWSSTDDAADGGQMNAMILADASGKTISGFYTENGVRCGEFSEFSADPIQPGRINPVLSGGQMNRVAGASAGAAFEIVGGQIPRPNGASYSLMVSKLGSMAKAPTTPAERRRCPVLVRAAAVVGCPDNSQSANSSLRTFEDATLTPKMRRCSVASSVQVKVRVEQVWEIAGTAKMQPIDTVLDPKSASSLSIDRILQQKYGNACPSGTRRVGDNCLY